MPCPFLLWLCLESHWAVPALAARESTHSYTDSLTDTGTQKTPRNSHTSLSYLNRFVIALGDDAGRTNCMCSSQRKRANGNSIWHKGDLSKAGVCRRRTPQVLCKVTKSPLIFPAFLPPPPRGMEVTEVPNHAFLLLYSKGPKLFPGEGQRGVPSHQEWK